ncbi:MAG: rhodanese-related sulfurtransferase [Planctomycetota bacterium]|jgi:rhodanese-related sulfurtransferase
MEITALCIALLSLLAVWSTRSTISELRDQVASLRSSVSSLGSHDLDELAERASTNSRFLARLAGGESLAPSQIREGQLWVDVTPQEAQALVEKGARVLDVRAPQEIGSGIISGAIHIPVDDLPARAAELPRDDVATLIYCSMGMRSAAACQYLSEQGYDSLFNLEDGFGSWPGAKERPA